MELCIITIPTILGLIAMAEPHYGDSYMSGFGGGERVRWIEEGFLGEEGVGDLRYFTSAKR